jgi:hypothetical protein
MSAADADRCRIRAANPQELRMRYTLLIAAVAMLASTSVGLARTQHHHVRQVPPGYGSTQYAPVQDTRSWLEIEHDLDPCHCDGGAP